VKIADYDLLSIGPTPKEIKRQRKATYDSLLSLGRPVIFKHRWNFQDANRGLCKVCPYFDETYHRNKTDCLYCYGTGFLGGFADGVVTFAIIADAPVDQLKISSEGVILFDKHPQMVAPWIPEMGDGDLIITAEFDRSNWEVLQTIDVFELNQVDPTTVRGLWGSYTDYTLYRIQQISKIDRVPNNHIYRNVPIEFDYTSVPVISPPVGSFPSDYPTPQATIEYGLRIIGREAGATSSTKTEFIIVGDGTSSESSIGIRMTGNVNQRSNVVVFE